MMPGRIFALCMMRHLIQALDQPQHAGNERRGVPAGHRGKSRRDSGGGVRPGRVPDLVVSGAQNYPDFPGEL